MKKTLTSIFWITGFVLASILLIVWMYYLDTNYRNYREKCEVKGGVVVMGHYSRNCATSGFIEINN